MDQGTRGSRRKNGRAQAPAASGGGTRALGGGGGWAPLCCVWDSVLEAGQSTPLGRPHRIPWDGLLCDEPSGSSSPTKAMILSIA